MNPKTISTHSEQTTTAPGDLSLVSRIFGDFRFHTDGDLLALAFAPDGTLWSVEEPGVLRHWNAASGQQMSWIFLSDLETLWNFSRDARFLISASDDLSLWDVARGQIITSLSQPSWVTAVALNADGTLLATGHDDGAVRLWDIGSKNLLREVHGHDRPISAVAFSPEGNRLASAGEDRIICLWEVATGRHLGTFNGHTDRIQAVAWHPRGHRLASAGWDTTARIWDASTFEPIILLNGHADQLTALAYSPDGGVLACADSLNALHIWDAEAGKDRCILNGHEDQVHGLAFSADGKRLASGGADRIIHLWDPAEGRLLSGKGEPVLNRIGLAISPDGKHLASTCGGAGMKIWDTAKGQLSLQPEDSDHLQVLAWNLDGARLAGGGLDNRVRLWDAATGKLERALTGQASRVTAVAFSKDSRTLASASATDGVVWLWNLKSGEAGLVIPEAADNCMVEALAFHPAGRLLAVGGIDWLATSGSDGAICIWDIVERRLLVTFDVGTLALAFDPSGRRLAAVTLVHSLCVYDVEGKKIDYEVTGHTDAATCVAYSPDGRILASGSDDRTLRLWDASTGKALVVRNLDSQIKALCFSPDGKYLFTANGNTTSYQMETQCLLDEEA